MAEPKIAKLAVGLEGVMSIVVMGGLVNLIFMPMA